MSLPDSYSIEKGKFAEFRVRETEDYRYEYFHEHRCDGNIVSILPVSFTKKIMLLRFEFTPAWGDGLHISSITGGWEKARHQTPIDTVIEEMEEEAGFVITNEDSIYTLGTCRGTKSSDTLYHIFMVDMDDPSIGITDITTDGSFLEGQAHNEWVSLGIPDTHLRTNVSDRCSWLMEGADPLLYVAYTRITTAMNFVKANRSDYAE